MSIVSTLKTATRSGLAFMALAGSLFTGSATAGASATPQFNNLQNDFPTLQVAGPNQKWGTTTTAQPGDVVNLFVWDHNTVVEANATNVRAKVTLPTDFSTSLVPSATVSADNAASVTGTATITVGSAAKLEYIPGTVKLYNNDTVANAWVQANFPAGVNADDIVTTGVLVTTNQAGCWGYAHAITLQARVVGGNPAITTNKKVGLPNGSLPYADSVNASPGDTVSYKIFLQNTGTGVGVNPRITDSLDPLLSYVPGSSFMLGKKNNQDFRLDIPDSLIKIDGQTLTWAFNNMDPQPDTALYLIFNAKVKDAGSFQVGTKHIPNCAVSSFTGISQQTNCVDVVVTKSVTPVVSFTLRKEVQDTTIQDTEWHKSTTVNPGDSVLYRLVITNSGNTSAANTIIKDVLPAGVTFTGNVKLYTPANPNGSAVANGSDLIGNGLNVGTVVNGNANAVVVSFTATVTNNCTGQQSLNNVATVYYNGQAMAQDNASITLTCVPGLTINKTVLDPADSQYKHTATATFHEGDVITYQVIVQNTAKVIVNHPVVWDVLPQYVQYIPGSMSIDGEFMSTAIQNAFFNASQGTMLTSLTPGMKKTIVFQVRVIACPPLGTVSLVNTASVKADSVSTISDTATASMQVRVPTLPSF